MELTVVRDILVSVSDRGSTQNADNIREGMWWSLKYEAHALAPF